MTIAQVIDRVRKLKDGYEIDEEQLINNINRVEMNLLLNVIKGREGDTELLSKYGNYNLESNRDTKLLASAPYDAVYELFCCAQIEHEHEDTERYTNAIIAYNELLQDFAVYWYRTHKQNRRYTFHA